MTGWTEVTGDRDARRLKLFGAHLLIYGLVAALSVLIDALAGEGLRWSVLIVVGWGAPLAIHAAWAMGLLDSRQ